ncbi:hypothetical protein MKW98_027161, partial [Papaver atlanticum]
MKAAEKEFEKSPVAFLFDCSVRERKAVGNFEPVDNDAISTLPFLEVWQFSFSVLAYMDEVASLANKPRLILRFRKFSSSQSKTYKKNVICTCCTRKWGAFRELEWQHEPPAWLQKSSKISGRGSASCDVLYAPGAAVQGGILSEEGGDETK